MISGVNSTLYQSQAAAQFQKMRAAFQQLGSDLQTGNVSAAQTDFQTVQQNASGAPGSAELNKLGQDLQNGNLPAAQQDYQSIHSHVSHGHGHALHGDTTSPTSLFPTTSTDPLSFFSNLAASAAAAYGSAGLTGALAAGSMVSQLV